jgi:hypothetical protein
LISNGNVEKHWAQEFSHNGLAPIISNLCFLQCHYHHKNQHWMAFDIIPNIWGAH